MMTPSSLHQCAETLIGLALAEDVGTGDVTARYFTPPDARARAFVTARAHGVISGTETAARVFARLDPDTRTEILVPDSCHVAPGAVLMRVEGKARPILTAERTALNFLQHLSGIATLTSRYVAAVEGSRARILDTRKTIPGFRLLAKKAVLDGGGSNHRMGLYDRAMVKDNHLATRGGPDALQEAIRTLKTQQPGMAVELEADHPNQVRTFLGLEGVDQILLDNMTLDQLRESVELRGDRTLPLFEASGGVRLDTVRDIAETGVDFISVGALTHSAPALDIALDFQPL